MTEFAEGPAPVWSEAKLGALEPALHRGPLSDPLRVFSRCVAIALGLALALQYYGFRDVELPASDLAIAIAHLVRGSWTFRAGGRAIHGLLQLLFYRASSTPSTVSSEGSTLLFNFHWPGRSIIAWFSSCSTPHRGRVFVEPATAFRSRWNSASAAKTKFRNLNQELAKRAADLETSNKELESFAYSVSHDLRAPLRHVVGYSELLQKQASSLLDEKSRRYMQNNSRISKKNG